MTADISSRRSSRRGLGVAALVAALALAAWNLSVTAPVSLELSRDSRNSRIGMFAYRSLGVHPTEITLDLWAFHDAAPIDLYRALFQAAGSLKSRHFSRIILARSGRAVFAISGDDFQALGQAYDAGENSLYLMRTLPEKLQRPDGAPAFGVWEGGWLGVMSKQMEDVNTMATTWVEGPT